ncbi:MULTISPECIES: sensor histidine kinase [Streptosporangium]|uniref:histidine kinase n=1 Tax=Streptosporangium brasiliense TaxID=47480 RepID=A0ABT9QV81_9ACTN|nr:nitrate- and nitrite sensing domain-containing protein [Streptosporangium brasiliense]MDP9860896.1 signal transduction histidine kinase [Streptosporangium brasiliense]
MSTHNIQGAGSGLRLRNWRVRSRLVALILVPTAAAVLLGGVQVFASMRAAADYQQVNDLARLSDHIGALTHELAEERDRTAWFIALGRPEREAEGVGRQMEAVDAAVAHVRDSGTLLRKAVSGRTRDEVETVITRLDDLGPLREQALKSALLPDAAIDAYSLVIADLLSLHDELGKGSADDVLYGQALTLDALARAKEAASLQRGLLAVVLVAGRFEQEQMEKFLGALSSERNERKTFAAEAGSGQRRLFDETVNGRTADQAEFLRELVLLRAASGASLKGLDLAERDDARQWYDAATVTIDRMRQVEQRHAQDIVTRSQELGDAEQSRALLVAGSVAGLLLVVLLITTGVARSLVRPLRRLRREALEVAGERLPAYVQRVREVGDDGTAAEVPPIGVISRDEIGEVARAFDEVHREAVRLAGDEAKLRNTVNAMFVNLSRRSQTLVERQLTLVERLERGERDDQRLADLFKLDHLATRMRRNSENLLVLAGQEVARRWRQPVELMDVVRASLSEVENYDRVVTRVQSEVAITGPAVSDVVHLLAELVENAVSFSPGASKVVVSSSRIDGGGVMVSVTDQGIGMTHEELSQANWRLANPQTADASVARRMGLFVVGRLALKHGIRVQLRPQDTGMTAMVLLPETLFAALPGLSQPAGPPRPPGALHPVAPPDSPFPARPDTPFPAVPETAAGPAFPPVPGAVPARTGASPAAVPLLAAPVPQETAVPPQTRSRWATGPNVWSPPAERPRLPAGEEGRFPPPPGLPDHRPGPAEADATGPLPKVEISALDSDEDFLPIFASVESGWFRVGAPAPASAGGAGQPDEPGESGELGEPGASAPVPAEPAAWSSPADTGWQAAQAASAPALGGMTTSGLPKRTPKANLVPGSVNPPPDPVQPPPAAPVSAERVRSRMSSFQEGVRKARNELPDREG